MVLSERFDAETWQPVLFCIAENADADALAALLESGRVRAVHDRIDDQLTELISAGQPGRVRTDAQWAAAKAEVLEGKTPAQHGNWVWYPWSGRLVHVLPREQFRLVRTDRNRDKITRADQAVLLDRQIGVIGLSVGNSAALTCVMEGVGGAFRLADFDRLGLSNLNRLRAGVHELGVEKTVLCARQMYEIDPYLDIEIWREGLTADTIDGFVDGLDLLVEECDTPWLKIAAREHARRLGIPVLMDTNDRGLLDVERFDLDPDRPLLHGRIGDTTADDVVGLDRPATIALMLRMVDETRISPALSGAIDQIGRTLSSWPQLASGTMLGGAMVTDTARRVLLGRAVPSGRFYVDLDRLIGWQS
ncbi:ThiF family adenylyltransferase [Kutzneria sp. 744]|uniref:ThiF family adenylyltransferase n=1 Tax=Kutzneria sp. (strain 744) TaxID=345341 RepID=UPI0009FC1A83|nr:ThiF family adenylyltransferase [Kutzneria sp. 744]